LAHQVPARLTPAEGRKFGLTVGAAFLVIAAVLWWRGKPGAVPWVGGLGALLALAGLVIPGQLGPVHRAWMGLALLLSKVTTPVFMGVVYFVVLTPVGMLMRALGKNPLRHPYHDGSFWVVRPAEARRRTDMERQF